MKVAATHYHYFINKLTVKVNKLKEEQKDIRLKLIEDIKYYTEHKVEFQRLNCDVTKFIQYARNGKGDYKHIHRILCNTNLSKPVSSDLMKFLRLANKYYHINPKLIESYSFIATMPYKVFVCIIREYNLQKLKLLFKGCPIYLNKHLGNISLLEKKRKWSNTGHTMGVDYAATKKLKQQILDAGQIPYCKQDEDAALARGEEYHGIKYLIYFTSDTQIWFKYRCDLNNKADNTALYRFIPSNFHNEDITKYNGLAEYYKTLTSFDQVVYDDTIGVVQKLKVLQILNPNYSYTLK